MRARVAFLAAFAILVTGCGEDGTTAAEPEGQPSSSGPTTPGRTTSSPAPVAGRGTTIKLARSQLGAVLFDAAGQAIYLFDKERSSTPDCYGGCAQAWPPVLTEGRPAASAGVSADLLGTTTRTDGSRQVTYAGHPLYFYAHEGKNEVKCHDIAEFGGLWLAVTASGDAAPH
jgi:predicted lipoprotein with Yx(FWY)xxD motif